MKKLLLTILISLPLFLQGQMIIKPGHWYYTDSVTILDALKIGVGDQFRINQNGRITRWNGLTYGLNPSVHVAGFLRNDGLGNLDWFPAAGIGTVTSIDLTAFTGINVAGVPITTSGTIVLSTTLNGIMQANGSGYTAATYTPGSVFFAGATGFLETDNANFFYNDTQDKMGLGLNTGIVARLHVKATGNTNADTTFLATNNSGVENFYVLGDGATVIRPGADVKTIFTGAMTQHVTDIGVVRDHTVVAGRMLWQTVMETSNVTLSPSTPASAYWMKGAPTISDVAGGTHNTHVYEAMPVLNVTNPLSTGFHAGYYYDATVTSFPFADHYNIYAEDGLTKLGTVNQDNALTKIAVLDGSNIVKWRDVSTISVGGYTDEEAQDAVGAMVGNSATISLTYNDATPSLIAAAITGAVANGAATLVTGDHVFDYIAAQGFLTAEVDGSITNELQTFNNTSDGTSHTVTLSNSGGSFQLVEGTGITLTTTGTAGDGIITIASSIADTDDQNLTYDQPTHTVQINDGTDAIIPLADDDGATEGLASFAAAEFNADANGNITLDNPYTTEIGQDGVGGIFTATTTITPTYNDGANTMTWDANTSAVANGAGTLTTGDQVFDYIAAQGFLTAESDPNAWLLDGNTVVSEKYIGTDDNFDLPFRVNNVEKMRLSTAGNLSLGGANTDAFNFHAEADSRVELFITTYGNSKSIGGANRANGTMASPTALLADQDMGEWGGRGFGGDWDNNASWGIRGQTAEIFTASAKGTRAFIMATPVGTETSVDYVVVDHNGNVGIGDVSSPAYLLTVGNSDRFGVTSAGKIGQYNNASLTNGQLLIGNTSTGEFDAASLTAGNNIDITPGAGAITIDVEALTSADLSDFTEAAQDAVGAALTDGTTIDFTYNDGAGTITAEGITAAVGNGAATLVTGDQVFDYIAAFNTHYTLQHSANSLATPADITTYYWGLAINSPQTTPALQRIYIEKTGVITSCYIFIHNGGTLGSSETSTMSIRLNNTTDHTVSAAVTTSAATQTFSNTALNIAVTAGDYIELKWVSPTWATNPTTLRMMGTIGFN